jgi:outer membrane protein OmpA-like peptidoglycan-associated protein
VKFETGKAILKAESFALLDEIASTLQIHPEITQIEIGGHTDDQGSDSSNLTLSQNRANAVRDYLVKKGIATSRMTTMGYGETRPIAPNKLATGRAQNRRVEFKITQRAPAGG